MGRQHPLDVFRSSRDGFDKASKRRKVAGKVIASSVKVKSTSGSASAGGRGKAPASRPAPTTPTKMSASRGGSSSSAPSRITRMVSGARLFAKGPDSGSKKRSGAARTADGTTRNIFFGAILISSAVALVLVFNQFWLGDGQGNIPTLKLGDVLPNGPGGALAPTGSADAAGDSRTAQEMGSRSSSGALAGEWFTIRAAVYNGSDRGLELALAAHTELVLRGLPDVTLIGNAVADPEAAAAGEYESFELLVGAARTAVALEGTLDRLLAIDDWAGGKAAPFVDARIVVHPAPQALESDG